MSSQGPVTRLLQDWQGGDADAAERLIPLVYSELHGLARRHMKAERSNHTLQPTALVHEAFLRLVDQHSVEWQNRAHFLAIGSQVMRRILVDYARRAQAAKRDGGMQVTLGDQLASSYSDAVDVVLVDQALERLAKLDPRQARVVELRFFGGLDNSEVAEVLSVSLATVKRDWVLAKAWLQRELGEPSA